MSLREITRKINSDLGRSVAAETLAGMTASITFWIPTGSWLLDQALARAKGGAGLAGGRIVEYWGESQTGKTTMAAAAMRSAQSMGGVAGFIDVESSLTPDRLEQLDVSTDMDKDFVYVHEEDIDIPIIFETCVGLAKELPPYSLLVWDTLAATQCGPDGKGGMGKRPIQLRAGFRELTPILSAHRVTLLILNHAGVDFSGFQAKQISGGGAALAYWASQSVRFAYPGKFQFGERQVGIFPRAYVTKNKLCPPPAQPKLIKYPLRYVSGVDKAYELWHFLSDNSFRTLDEAAQVVKKGGWCYIRGYPEKDEIKHRYAQLPEVLEKHPGLLEYLEMMADHHVGGVV